MNHFCEDCQHCKVPYLVKEKFNSEVKDIFLGCPTSDPKIVYCFTKHYNINWLEFLKFIIREGKLNDAELEYLEKEGRNEIRKRGE